MDWKETGPFRDQIIWVRELPTEGWFVAIVPDRSAPAGQANRVPPSEERALPEAFPPEVAAVAAAMRFLDRQHERRTEAQG